VVTVDTAVMMMSTVPEPISSGHLQFVPDAAVGEVAVTEDAGGIL
jgi:hypothetical protein